MKRLRAAKLGLSVFIASAFILTWSDFSMASEKRGSSFLSAVVTADEVAVYSQPSLDGLIIGRLWHGVRVTVYGIHEGWLLVEASNGKRGWSRSDFLETIMVETKTVRTAREFKKSMEVWPLAEPYLIKPGDTIDIKSYTNPELNDQVVVRPDGYISLILVDDVYVAGLTPSELDTTLTEKYGSYVLNPELTVVLNQIKEVAESRVFVGGEVGHPQELPLQVPSTVLHAVIAAGGFLYTANEGNVILIRKGAQNQPIIYNLDLRKVKKGDRIQDNLYLKPFDIIYVPKTRIAEAAKFVDQHVNDIVPDFLSVGFTWFRQFGLR